MPEIRRAARRALEAERTTPAEPDRRLHHPAPELRQARKSRKSEKLTAEERQLAFQDLQMAVAEVEVAPTKARTARAASTLVPTLRNIGRQPADKP
ncbi:MAG: transposase [Paracoccaceae bacterium]|jgi:transposase